MAESNINKKKKKNIKTNVNNMARINVDVSLILDWTEYFS